MVQRHNDFPPVLKVKAKASGKDANERSGFARKGAKLELFVCLLQYDGREKYTNYVSDDISSHSREKIKLIIKPILS